MLTTDQLLEIKQLQQICEREDAIKLKLNWDMLESRSNKENNDFFAYEHGQLIGFLGLYGFGPKVELCGMVHPHFRRQGIFSGLLQKGLEECKRRQAREILLNAPAGSQAATSFLAQSPCRYSFSEYQMKYQTTEDTLQPSDDAIIRPATPEDCSLEVQLDVDCFGFDQDEALSFYNQIRSEGNQDFYIIEVNQIAIGKIRVQRMGEESWIFGFSILPQHQGKGYGRSVLAKVVQAERRLGNDVFLEVAAQNENALRLYISNGFIQFNTQDYYEYVLE